VEYAAALFYLITWFGVAAYSTYSPGSRKIVKKHPKSPRDGLPRGPASITLTSLFLPKVSDTEAASA